MQVVNSEDAPTSPHQPTLPEPAAPAHRTSHRRAVQILPQIHQRQKCAQNARLQIIRQRHSARRHARQPFAILRQKLHDLFQPFMRRVSHRRLAPHLRAVSFNRKRVVQHAQLLFGKRRGGRTLASGDLAVRGHRLRGYGNATATLLANITLRSKSSLLRSLVSHIARSANSSPFLPWRLAGPAFHLPAVQRRRPMQGATKL